jgi:hypothetical protein
VFVGSNKLKHNTTGMLELRFTPDGKRYAMFTKNRRGNVNVKLYYDLSSTGDVRYESEVKFSHSEVEDMAKQILSKDNPYNIIFDE